jgi:hypothetical protein
MAKDVFIKMIHINRRVASEGSTVIIIIIIIIKIICNQ